ncbi:MAG: endonuclease/exonuclease/phosphatase family protein [Flavobacteriales bacterium]|nr:endonuclease/exonuclease/phosphatase family protein [Flavobacteriales bacterium]
MKSKWWLEWVIGTGLILLSISHWFPLGIGPLELLGAFAHFTVILSAISIFLSLIYKLRSVAISALVSLCISGALVLPHFSSLHSSGQSDFTIGQFNFYHHSLTPEKGIEVIDADIFTIQEMNDDWKPLIEKAFATTHPYQVVKPWEGCCYGIGLYSKFPILSSHVIELDRTPVIIAEVDINGNHVMVISLHTRPPVAPNETPERNAQLMAVAKMAAASANTCIVLGDFNIVPWDATFKDFLKAGDLTPVRDGFQATYPMDLGFPLIPIDHITYRGNLVGTSSNTITIPGSDHRGMVVGFAFKD